jgi:DNA repair exonuclease SbcCD ATPase subunit
LDKLSELEGQCPTCEQDIDEEKLKELTEIYTILEVSGNDQNRIVSKQIEDARANNLRVGRRDALQKEFEEVMGRVDNKLPLVIFDKEEISSQITTLSSKIQGLQDRLREIAAENIKAGQHNTRLEIIQEQTASFERELEEIVEALGKVEDRSIQLEILKKAFSTNGLLAYKIENLVKDLEDLTNDYLAELSDGRFSLEFVVTNDRLNVEITDNAKIVDILALSSGELARVNTATLLAIRKLMSSISSSKINTLFLDEVINVLDDQGREKLVEILLGETLNTYIVSHGWTHPLLEKIEVIKEDNISRLE